MDVGNPWREYVTCRSMLRKTIVKKAWLNPNENVIRHGEWVIRNRLPNLAQSTKLNFSESKEALAWRYFYALKVKEAMGAVYEWALEEPYSAGPFILGSSLSVHIGNPEEGVQLARRGLIANPDDFTLKNNLAFAYLMSKDINNAESIILGLPSNSKTKTDIFYAATKGLLKFKKGNIILGRELYVESIQKCKDFEEPELAVKASLCLALAEFEADTKEAKETMMAALKVSKHSEMPDIILLRKRLQKEVATLS